MRVPTSSLEFNRRDKRPIVILSSDPVDLSGGDSFILDRGSAMGLAQITEYRQCQKDRKEHYKRRFVSAEEAAKAIKSGDLVAHPFAARRNTPSPRKAQR